tara:strand:+ start:7866 stop:8489 length:624 start_codon:yes stop_codon:yes gene_type:complete
MKTHLLNNKKKFIVIFLLLTLLSFSKSYGNDDLEGLKLISIGNNEAPVKIKVFSSLTCPHCANFHLNVISEIKKKYVSSGKVKIIFVDFPLDLAALNASKIIHCAEKKLQMKVMDLIYEKQNKWAEGNTIEEINDKLKKITKTIGINSDKVDKCFLDENIENIVLNSRINGDKKYSISSTPTIIINEKKYKGKNNFEEIEKEILKII